MKKINIAELLKDCPKGMELDCTIWDNVVFEEIDGNSIIIFRKSANSKVYLTRYGEFNSIDGKCVIFPKGKTTWEGFQKPFKDGDIVTWEDRGSLVAFIYKERKDVALIKHHFALYTGSLGTVINGEISLVESEIVFATEEEKQKLFKAIKDNGYRWNAETNTLEELPKFKVGNNVKLKGGDEFGIITQVADSFYTIKNKDHTHYWSIEKQDDWELVIEPIFKVGNKIKDTRNNSKGVVLKITDEGYECHFEYGNFLVSFKDQDNWELVSDKFDITTLKPFDRVLVRTDVHNPVWSIDFYDGYNIEVGGSFTPFAVTGGQYFQQCIPYKGNEHLRGTTNDCDDFYKTWEK